MLILLIFVSLVVTWTSVAWQILADVFACNYLLLS